MLDEWPEASHSCSPGGRSFPNPIQERGQLSRSRHQAETSVAATAIGDAISQIHAWNPRKQQVFRPDHPHGLDPT
jgi:hypothetical protein